MSDTVDTSESEVFTGRRLTDRLKRWIVGLTMLVLSGASAGITDAIWDHTAKASIQYWREWAIGVQEKCFWRYHEDGRVLPH